MAYPTLWYNAGEPGNEARACTALSMCPRTSVTVLHNTVITNVKVFMTQCVHTCIWFESDFSLDQMRCVQEH